MNKLRYAELITQILANSYGFWSSLKNSLLFWCLIAGLVLLICAKTKLLFRFYFWLTKLMQRYWGMPRICRQYLVPMFWRILRSNWYTVLLLVVLWILFFYIDAGSDLIISFVGYIIKDGEEWWWKLLAIYFLFFLTLLTALAIWAIPFFLFTGDRVNRINLDRRSIQRFYVGCRILSIVATVPFLILANAFFFRYVNEDVANSKVIGVNGAILLFLAVFDALILNWKTVKAPMENATVLLRELVGRVFPNYYFNLLTRLLLIELLYSALVLLAVSLIDENLRDRDAYISCIIGGFMVLSGVTVFRLIFFTNGVDMKQKDIRKRVDQLTSAKTAAESKKFYYTLFWFLCIFNLTFFLLPSMTAINTMFVVLAVFAFLINYVDFCRHLAVAEKPWQKILGYLGIVIFLVAPNITPPGQFVVPLRELKTASAQNLISCERFSKGLGPVDSKRLLENAIERRIKFIESHSKAADSSNIYIVCGMGGGSRAGYFTARVLGLLDNKVDGFWSNTLLYSTVSGSSPGTYHYLKHRIAAPLEKEELSYLQHIYRQNFNSSGMFGLLLGDGFEGAFGGLINRIKALFSPSKVYTAFRDRNVRIRQEYDFALKEALAGTGNEKFLKNTFRFGVDISEPDDFQGFYLRNQDTIPIHLVNTFEVNSGRRTVLSPFVAGDTTLFSNAIQPLQDISFSDSIAKRDITYREAVNLSELFPFLSAASTIGENDRYQFVDGGYFENYGLATALDVVRYLESIQSPVLKRLKIVLIKNSLQRSKVEKSSLQLLAPLVGVINAPFTGHANQLLSDGIKKFNENMVVLEFDPDADTSKISLTRALTTKHIKALDEQAISQVMINEAAIRRLSATAAAQRRDSCGLNN